MFEKLLVPATWVATAGYAVTGALELLHDQRATFASPLDYLIEIAFALGLGATAVATYAFYRHQAPHPFGRGRLAVSPRSGTWRCSCRQRRRRWLVTTRSVRRSCSACSGRSWATAPCSSPTCAAWCSPARAGVVLLVGLVGSVVLGAATAAMLTDGGGGTLALAASWAAVARLVAGTAARCGRVRTA